MGTNVGGSTRIGLLRSCMTIRNQPTECFTQSLTAEWALSLIFIFFGCVCLTTALAVTILSQWQRGFEKYSRWAGFQLPNNYTVGISYIFFVMAIWITVISELFA